MDSIDEILFFSGNGNHRLGASTLEKLSEFIGKDCSFKHIDFSDWPDGESDSRIPEYEKIAGKTVVFYQSIYTPKYMEEALELIWAIKKQYRAKYLIAVLPFVFFRRQDHPEKNYEINRLLMIIDRLHHAGMDELITVTPHSEMMSKNCQECGVKFRAIDLSASFANTVNTYVPRDEEKKLIRIYAPDLGSVPRAINLAKMLNAPVVFSFKERGINNEVSMINADREKVSSTIKEVSEKYNFPVEQIYYSNHEEIDGKIIVMVEDEFSTGTTANNTGVKLREYNAKEIFLVGTHPVLTSAWRRKLFFKEPFSKVIMANTIPRDYEKRTGGRIHDISVSFLLAQGIYISLSET